MQHVSHALSLVNSRALDNDDFYISSQIASKKTKKQEFVSPFVFSLIKTVLKHAKSESIARHTAHVNYCLMDI